MRIRYKAALFTALILLLQGCSTVKRDKVDLVVADAFERIASSMEQLALIESAAKVDEYKTQTHSYQDLNLPAIWHQEVVLVDDFYGSIENFIQVISLISGLNAPEVYENGFRPKFISIAKGKREVISFIADAGYQTGSSVDVMPIISTSSVVVRYKGVNN